MCLLKLLISNFTWVRSYMIARITFHHLCRLSAIVLSYDCVSCLEISIVSILSAIVLRLNPAYPHRQWVTSLDLIAMHPNLVGFCSRMLASRKSTNIPSKPAVLVVYVSTFL